MEESLRATKRFCTTGDTDDLRGIPSVYLEYLYQGLVLSTKPIAQKMIAFFEDEGRACREGDYFSYVVRAQVPTSSSKNDTYFARMKRSFKGIGRGELVLVKGPYRNSAAFSLLRFYAAAKKILGLPRIRVQKLVLYRSTAGRLFSEKPAEGLEKSALRPNLPRDKRYVFLVFENLCGEVLPTAPYADVKDRQKAKKSLAWTSAEARIVDWDSPLAKRMNCRHVTRGDGNGGDFGDQGLLRGYLMALFFRELFGIKDPADRNFLVSGRKLYSIDEENINVALGSRASVAKHNIRVILARWTPGLSSYLTERLGSWKAAKLRAPLQLLRSHLDELASGMSGAELKSFRKRFALPGDALAVLERKISLLARDPEGFVRGLLSPAEAKKVEKVPRPTVMVPRYAWIFGDRVDCQTVRGLPMKAQTGRVFVANRKRLLHGGHRGAHGLNGIQDDLLVSALQKYVRRNVPSKAIWSALDRSFMRCDTETKSVGKLSHLRNRLKIIYLEDIGIANVDLWTYMADRVDCIRPGTSASCRSIEQTIVDVVARMAQSAHTRMVSYVKSITQLRDLPADHRLFRYLPYFPVLRDTMAYIDRRAALSDRENFTKALADGHLACFYYFMQLNYPMRDSGNGRKRSLGRNLKGEPYLFTYTALLQAFKSKGLSEHFVKIADQWYRSFSNEETYFTYYQLMLMLCFPFKRDGYVQGSSAAEYSSRWKDLVMHNIRAPAIELEDFVADMHTTLGRRLGKGKHTLKGRRAFLYEGAYVEEEYVPNATAKELKNFYEFKTLLLCTGHVEEAYLRGD